MATPIDVTILGVSFKTTDGKSGGTADSTARQKNLIFRKTGFEIPITGFHVMHIVNTKTGRIFLAADDGHLYEITYDSEEHWFKRKCDLKDCTSSWLRKILPARTRDSKISLITYDPSRSMLYTINLKNEIRVFSLGELEDSFQAVSKLENFYDQLASFTKQFQTSKEDFQLISIDCIQKKESKRYCCVVVTRDGDRVFLEIKDFGSPHIQIAHVRFIPEEPSLRMQTVIHKKCTKALCLSGVFLISTVSSQEMNSICMASVNYPKLLVRRY